MNLAKAVGPGVAPIPAGRCKMTRMRSEHSPAAKTDAALLEVFREALRALPDAELENLEDDLNFHCFAGLVSDRMAWLLAIAEFSEAEAA